jgi:hypothetical protein
LEFNAKECRVKPGYRTKADALRHWYQEDNLNAPAFPGASNPEKPEWDRRYLERLVEFFGGPSVELIPVDIPVADATPFNIVYNHDRRDLYQEMMEAGEPIPPIVAERDAFEGKWRIKDGSHRWDAALKANPRVTHLRGFERRRLVNQPSNDVARDVATAMRGTTEPAKP